MNDSDSIKPGRYRHYKGNQYTVVGIAKHSETLEELVVYRQEYGEHGLWVRPSRMFAESVHVEGRVVQRFEPVGPNIEQSGQSPTSIFNDLPPNLPREVVETLISGSDLRIERIVSHGHASASNVWYDQQQHEWVIVLKGAARLQFEDGMIEMGVGDFINIPASRKHRVDWTTPSEPTVWLAVHYGGEA